MTLIAFGINHKTAPVALREQVAFGADALVDALASLQKDTGAKESVILSTCNRTEIYISADRANHQLIVDWLAQFHAVSPSMLQQHCYVHVGQAAVCHLMRVASGLDSLILGEPQILGQVKQAFNSAKNSGTVSAQFERLFQQTFAVAKKVRSETEIGANAVSVAYAAVQLARQIFSSLDSSRVLLIGAGETIELVARHLCDQGAKHLFVANRTLARAHKIAEPLNGKVLTLAQIPAHLAEADIVISSTASQLPILGKGMVERALKDRRHRPMFLVDLAVPRDIEGEVAELSDAYLYSVDDLQQIIEQNIASRQNAALEAEQMIATQVDTFMQWTEAQGSVDLLRAFRLQNEQQRDKLKIRALNQLAEGKDPAAIISELSHKLTNSLIHPPTKALKQAAESADKNSLNLLINAFGLNSED